MGRLDGAKNNKKKKDRAMWEKKRRCKSWSWRLGDGGADGTGKVRRKQKGETDNLETGQAMQARFC